MKLLEIFSRFGWKTSGSVHYIGGSDVLPPPLKGEEELAALEALQQGD